MRGRHRRLVLVIAAGLAIVVAGAYLPLLIAPELWWRYSPGVATVTLVYSLLWLPVIAITFRRDPTNRMWVLILLYLAATATASLAFLKIDVAWTIEAFFHPLGSAILAHLCLAFPTGRLRHRVDRVLMGTAYAIVLPIQLLGLLVWDPTAAVCQPSDWCPRNLLMLARDDNIYRALQLAALLAPVLAAAAIIELFRHWRSSSRAGQRALAPIALGTPLGFAIIGLWWAAPVLGRQDIQDFLQKNSLIDLAWFLTPCLFLLGAGLTRLGRGAVADLAIAIGRGVPLGGLETAIARALRDPTLRVAFPAPTTDGLVDPEGHPFELPADRATARLEREGQVLAVIVYDPAVDREDPGLVSAAGNVARLALENERLSAQVRAQLEEVRASRQRIVQAADTERRRVERDLHDGAQQRLVALAMRLELARETATGAGTLIDETTAELGRAIAEVRGLARGLHPPILTEAGLRAAVESLAERTPIPIEIDIPDERFSAAVEATAYHVIAETLTDIAERPGATGARVVVRSDDQRLRLRIEDEGSPVEADPDQGSKLRALLDRVAAVGGSLSIERAASGMRIDAEVPV